MPESGPPRAGYSAPEKNEDNKKPLPPPSAPLPLLRPFATPPLSLSFPLRGSAVPRSRDAEIAEKSAARETS